LWCFPNLFQIFSCWWLWSNFKESPNLHFNVNFHFRLKWKLGFFLDFFLCNMWAVPTQPCAVVSIFKSYIRVIWVG
jgi:hypothetical protein